MTLLDDSFRITPIVILHKKDKEEPLVIGQVSKRSLLLGYVFGSVGMIVMSIVLLFNLCRTCSETSSIGPTGQWLLPTLGLVYGLFVFVVSCFEDSALATKSIFKTAANVRTFLVIFASLLMPLALGVMVIASMKVCLFCLVFWLGQLIVLFSFLDSHERLGSITVTGMIAISLMCFGFWKSPPTNLAAKSILFEAGFQPKADDSPGLPIGSEAPEIDGVPRSGVIVFWTNCPPCVKESLPSALAALNRSTDYTIVATDRDNLTSYISARSKVVIVSKEVFEQYGFEPAGTPMIVWLENGKITRSMPASALTGEVL